MDTTYKAAAEKPAGTEENGIPKPGSVILFPDARELMEEVARLKTELSMLYLEHDQLRLVVCKNIETAYYLKFGALLHKVYKLECTVLRLKRKSELIQAAINRNEPIRLTGIEAQLDIEFADYQKRLEETVQQMNNALEYSRMEALSDKDAHELKTLYRKIVKQLHPDLNPNATQEQKRLLENAIIAYKNGDLEMMRIIAEVAVDIEPVKGADSVSALRDEKERLLSSIASVKAGIAKIKEEYPYNLKPLVFDKIKGDEYTEELNAILSEYEELADYYKERLESQLGRKL